MSVQHSTGMGDAGVLLATDQLEAFLFEAGDDLGDQTTLNAIGLDHDEGALTRHPLLHSTLNRKAPTRSDAQNRGPRPLHRQHNDSC